jgi:hypothetical protein
MQRVLRSSVGSSREALTVLRVEWSTATNRPHPHAGQAGGSLGAHATTRVSLSADEGYTMMRGGQALDYVFCEKPVFSGCVKRLRHLEHLAQVE